VNRKPEEGQKVRLNNYGLERISEFYNKKINEKVRETIFIVLSVTKPTYLDHYGLWYVTVNNTQLNRCELNSLFFDAID